MGSSGVSSRSCEVEANKYTPTSLQDKRAVVMRVHAKSPGGCWNHTTKSLCSILGENKRSTAQRWVVLARDVDSETLSGL